MATTPWSIDEAKAFGLATRLKRYAFPRVETPFTIHGERMVIDLREKKLVANNTDNDARVQAMDLPQFKHLKELLVWIRLQS